jgi:hypothetical protein
MGTIYLGIAILAIVVSGLSEYRRQQKNNQLRARTVYAKKKNK